MCIFLYYNLVVLYQKSSQSNSTILKEYYW